MMGWIWSEFQIQISVICKYLTICLMLAIDQIVFSIERQIHSFWIEFDKLVIVLTSWSSTTADLEQQQFTQCGISPLLSLIKFEIFVRILKSNEPYKLQNCTVIGWKMSKRLIRIDRSSPTPLCRKIIGFCFSKNRDVLSTNL